MWIFLSYSEWQTGSFLLHYRSISLSTSSLKESLINHETYSILGIWKTWTETSTKAFFIYFQWAVDTKANDWYKKYLLKLQPWFLLSFNACWCLSGSDKLLIWADTVTKDRVKNSLFIWYTPYSLPYFGDLLLQKSRKNSKKQACFTVFSSSNLKVLNLIMITIYTDISFCFWL